MSERDGYLGKEVRLVKSAALHSTRWGLSW